MQLKYEILIVIVSNLRNQNNLVNVLLQERSPLNLKQNLNKYFIGIFVEKNMLS